MNLINNTKINYMTIERIKEIQAETAYPNSTSVQQALLKVWNECEQGEQLICPRCKSNNCLLPDKENDAECNDCSFVWSG